MINKLLVLSSDSLSELEFNPSLTCECFQAVFLGGTANS